MDLRGREFISFPLFYTDDDAQDSPHIYCSSVVNLLFVIVVDLVPIQRQEEEKDSQFSTETCIKVDRQTDSQADRREGK